MQEPTLEFSISLVVYRCLQRWSRSPPLIIGWAQISPSLCFSTCVIFQVQALCLPPVLVWSQPITPSVPFDILILRFLEVYSVLYDCKTHWYILMPIEIRQERALECCNHITCLVIIQYRGKVWDYPQACNYNTCLFIVQFRSKETTSPLVRYWLWSNCRTLFVYRGKEPTFEWSNQNICIFIIQYRGKMGANPWV